MDKDPASLDQLHDIVVPDAIPWWPPAPGWWVVLALLLALGLFLAVRGFRKWRANAYRRAALRELDSASSAPAIAEILRRTALAIAPREAIATLQGPAWTNWLAERSPEAIPEPVRDLLARSLYDPSRPETPSDPLRGFAERWIRHHTPPC